MARTFTPITGGGGGGAYQAGDKLGYQAVEKIRQALDQALYLAGHLELGGDERAILSAAFTRVNGARTLTLQGDNLGGLTLELVAFYYTLNTATQVQVRLRNTTDNTTAATGTSSNATSLTREVIAVTLASGNKDYQLQVTGSNADNGVFAWGYLRAIKVPA